MESINGKYVEMFLSGAGIGVTTMSHHQQRIRRGLILALLVYFAVDRGSVRHCTLVRRIAIIMIQTIALVISAFDLLVQRFSAGLALCLFTLTLTLLLIFFR